MAKKFVIVANVPSSILIFRRELVKHLISLGFEVFCFANGFSEEDKNTIKNWGAIPKSHHLNVKGLNPISDLKATYDLYKTLKEIKPEFLLACFVKPVIFSSIAAFFAGIKHRIGMIEGLGNAFTEIKDNTKRKTQILKFIQILLYKCSLPLLNKLILLNDDDKKDLIDKYHIPIKDLCILGGIGVDLQQFSYCSPPPSTPITFLFVGRLVSTKGIFEFVDAAKEIKHDFPHVSFRVAGDFDENNPFSIGQQALKQSIQDNTIEHIGYVQDIASEIQRCHVFVLPSYREGVPRSTQEAMSIGRAVITTNVPGCNLTVKEGVNGFLIPHANAKALAEKMRFFINNPNMIEIMGRASRKLAEEHFDTHKINKKLLDFIFSSTRQ